MNIIYIKLNHNQIDLIKPLWAKLRDHHHELSTNFPERYGAMKFED